MTADYGPAGLHGNSEDLQTFRYCPFILIGAEGSGSGSGAIVGLNACSVSFSVLSGIRNSYFGLSISYIFISSIHFSSSFGLVSTIVFFSGSIILSFYSL